MKIIMDLRKYDGVVGGVEQGALQVARQASRQGHDIIMVCKKRRKEEVAGLIDGEDRVRIHPLDVTSHAISWQNVRIDSHVLQDLAESEGADLIHFFYNWSFPFGKKVPSILTVHDVIPFTFREAMGFWRNRFIYRPAIRAACRLNNIVATVSEYSKQDIAKTVGVPLQKIRVVHNGLRDPAAPDKDLLAEITRRFALGDGFILNVGGIHERKNIVRMVKAFAGLVKDKGYPGKLVITGSVSGPPYQERMKKLCDEAIAEAGMGDRVVFTGFISEEELDLLLAGASMLVYPSLYEGFGIPILEAMKVGTPVVTSNVTAMPEVAGGAAVLVDPLDVGSLASGMASLLDDAVLRADLVAKGRERASGYSWDRSATMYCDLYQEVVRG